MRITTIETEKSLDKNVRFQDFKERLKKVEGLLNIMDWNTERYVILDQAHRQMKREVEGKASKLGTQLRDMKDEITQI